MKLASEYISNFYPHSVSGKTDDSFIGLKIIGNEIHFYYPETYDLDLETKEIRNDVVDLLRTISIAKTGSSNPAKAYNLHNHDGEFALLSYLWVINDYITNGFYINRERMFKTNQNGRVNWKRTMQTQPIVSQGNVIYPNITVEVKSTVDNLIVEIHKFCVKKSIDFIGWLFNLESSFIEKQPYNETIKKIYLQALQQELDKTFDDDKRILLTHLNNIVTGLDVTSNNNEFVYGVDSYYYIFERMIDSIFGNVKNIKEFNPSASWHLVRNNYKGIASSELRPDTIIFDDNTSTAYIIDSKFYRFGYTGKDEDLPETTSIQKQITYGDFIKENVSKFNIKNIYNAFIIPYNKQDDFFRSDNDLQYVGFAKSSWKDNSRKHEYIHTFLIDLKHVIKTWNRYNHKQDVNTLVNEIERHSKEINDLVKQGNS